MIPPLPPVQHFAGHIPDEVKFSPPFSSPRPASPLPFEYTLDGPLANPSNHRHHRQNDALSSPRGRAAISSRPFYGTRWGHISSCRLGILLNHNVHVVDSTRRIRLPSLWIG